MRHSGDRGILNRSCFAVAPGGNRIPTFFTRFIALILRDVGHGGENFQCEITRQPSSPPQGFPVERRDDPPRLGQRAVDAQGERIDNARIDEQLPIDEELDQYRLQKSFIRRIDPRAGGEPKARRADPVWRVPMRKVGRSR